MPQNKRPGSSWQTPDAVSVRLSVSIPVASGLQVYISGEARFEGGDGASSQIAWERLYEGLILLLSQAARFREDFVPGESKSASAA